MDFFLGMNRGDEIPRSNPQVLLQDVIISLYEISSKLPASSLNYSCYQGRAPAQPDDLSKAQL